MHDDQALPFFVIGDCGNGKQLLCCARDLLEFVLHLYMRDHLTANLAEPAEAVGDMDESVFVDGGDVAGVVPAIPQDFSRFFRTSKITLHYVGSTDQQQ